MIRLFLFSAFFALALGAVSPAHAACADAAMTIRAPTLSSGDERSFEKRFRQSLSQVCKWWGPTFEGPYTIDIEESRGPSMALVPAWRGNQGRILFRGNTVRLGRAAITHEIVHVLAPNANRLLAEGLAVYAHILLQGEPAFPNFGKDFTAEARKLSASADIGALDGLATPTRLKLLDLDNRDAYIVAGSFVGFLIERHGLEIFRELYDLTSLVPRERNAGAPGRWRKTYGISLEGLVDEWRASLAE